MLKYGILGLLNYHEMTGYEIMEVFRDSLNFFWTAQTSQIYRELQTLEKKEWVKKQVILQQGKPDKNLFSITDRGRKELLLWLADGDFGRQRNSLLMKVFFMGERSREENIQFFQGLIRYFQMMSDSYSPVTEAIQNYDTFLGGTEHALYWGMTLDYGRRNCRMNIEWAENCIKELEG